MKRKNELSLLNIIFCLLVIFIHIASAPIAGLSKGSWQYGVFFVPWRLSSFVVQGFIFLSGLKMFLKTDSESYKKYYITRFNKVVVPYIFAVVLFYGYFLNRGYFGFNAKELLGYVLFGDLVAHFYFVIAIVQFYLLKPLWKLVTEKVSPKIAIPVSAILMILSKYIFADFVNNDRLFTTYIGYWIMGCYAGKYYDTFLENVKKHKKAYISVFVIVAIIEAVVSYRQFVYDGMVCLEELHILYSISAILFTLCIALKFGNGIMERKTFGRIDNASYYIYLIHPLIIFLVNENLIKWGITDIGAGFVIRAVVTYFVSIALSVVYMETKRRIKRKIKCLNSEKQK